MNLRTYVIAGLFVAALFAPCRTAISQQQSRLGIVAERPASGPFVETDAGFMVPYTAQIPGSDVTFEMVPVPGGRFLFGSPVTEEGREEFEGPQLSVMMDPFWIGKYEVTWKEYRVYMKLCEVFKEFDDQAVRVIEEDRVIDVVTAPSLLYDPSFTYEGGEGPNTPAVTMTQFAAKQYTKWLSLLTDDFYRLPSEAEWEYACRAGTTTAFSFGDDIEELPEHAWYAANSLDIRHEVGGKLPNPWGLYDMHGNAAEWVLDAFTEEGYAAIGDGMVTPQAAIQWPKEIYPRVARGGSWEMDASSLRSAARLGSSEDWKDNDPCFPTSPWWHTTYPATGVGMRIVRPLTAPEAAEEREKFWGADHEDIQGDADYRIDEEGRGARGLVDPDLPNAIRD